MKKQLAVAIALAFFSAATLAEDRAVPGAEKVRPDTIGHSPNQYQSLDADGDGFLNKNEAQANSSINFDELDADKDGRISMQEMTDAQGKSGASASGSASSDTGAAGRAGEDMSSASGSTSGDVRGSASGNAGEAGASASGGASGSSSGSVSTDTQK
jgi:hypothetical protein